MRFDHDYLMELADQFEKKAEQLLETAESIRETASIMSPSDARQKKAPPPPPPEPVPEPQSTHAPAPPIERHPQESNSHTNNKHLGDNQPTFSPLEKHVMDSLGPHIAGLSVDKIVGYCKQQGVGTSGSVQVALGKLTKSGHVTRLQRGRYALPTAFNTAQKELN